MNEYETVLTFLLSLSLLLTPVLAEDTSVWMAQGNITNGTDRLTFLYPDGLEYHFDGKFGTSVTLQDVGYLVINLLPAGTDPATDVNEVSGGTLLQLSDGLWVNVVGRRTAYSIPGTPVEDIIQVALVLPDGSAVTAQSIVLARNTEMYPILQTVVDSMTDGAPLAQWLEETWIPFVVQET